MTASFAKMVTYAPTIFAITQTECATSIRCVSAVNAELPRAIQRMGHVPSLRCQTERRAAAAVKERATAVFACVWALAFASHRLRPTRGAASGDGRDAVRRGRV